MFLNKSNVKNLHAVNHLSETENAGNYGYHPLTSSNNAPSFYIFKNDFISADHSLNVFKDFFIALKDLLVQPLTLLFYNITDGKAPRLKMLSSLSKDISIMGGKLLVITNSAPESFYNNLWMDAGLNIFYDANNFIAKKFRIHNAESPLWQWVSGIEDDLPLPATYVIAPDGKIVFHYIDYTFELFSSGSLTDAYLRTMLTTVYRYSEKYFETRAV